LLRQALLEERAAVRRIIASDLVMYEVGRRLPN
jgi:hypothetical protein